MYTASRFDSVSEEETLKINEEETPINTKKATKFCVSVFVGKFLFFYSLFFYFIFDGKFSAWA